MKPKAIIKLVITLIILGALGYGIWYSISEYNRQQAALGIVICSETECSKSMHIHADIEFDLCERGEIGLPRETGELNGLHTHKERNYLHFHDSVPLDFETREQMPDERLSIQEVIDIFDLDIEKYCDMSRNPQISVLINGQAPEQGLAYNWKDGDDIKLIYSY